MRFLLPLALLLSTSCGMAGDRPTAPPSPSPSPSPSPMETALIVGSAETPDPVLAKVQELERRGVVKDVVVYESFPVQIRLRAPKAVIDELDRMPRVGGIERKP